MIVVPCRYKIVRHRVVWLLGTWVTVKMSPELRPSVYAVLVPLLTRNEDLAVRISHRINENCMFCIATLTCMPKEKINVLEIITVTILNVNKIKSNTHTIIANPHSTEQV